MSVIAAVIVAVAASTLGVARSGHSTAVVAAAAPGNRVSAAVAAVEAATTAVAAATVVLCQGRLTRERQRAGKGQGNCEVLHRHGALLDIDQKRITTRATPWQAFRRLRLVKTAPPDAARRIR
jgi:50S ribosomal subunit-associated GTPase HflX